VSKQSKYIIVVILVLFLVSLVFALIILKSQQDKQLQTRLIQTSSSTNQPISLPIDSQYITST
jgi:hypothetical protein